MYLGFDFKIYPKNIIIMKKIIKFDYELWGLDEKEVSEKPGVYILKLLITFQDLGLTCKITKEVDSPYVIELTGESDSIKDILVKLKYIDATEFDEDIKLL